MRIERLDLTAFGVFTNETIEFSGKSFHVIHGPNAVGKSTARAAVSNLLYGFGRSSTYAFVHPLNRLEIGGCVTDKDGNSLDVIRYKKDRADLVNATSGTAVSPGDWSTFLQGVDREDFQRIYTIGWSELLEGTASLISGGGALGEALFASGLGIRDIRNVLESLDVEAAKLFAPRGQKPIVNSALRAAEVARKEAVALSVKPTKFDTTRREHERAFAKRHKLAEERIALDAEVERLTILRGVLPQLRARSQYLEEKSEIEDSSVAPPSSWAVRVNDALVARSNATRDKSEATLRGAFATDKLKELHPDPAALEIAVEVDSLAEGIHGYSQGLSDRSGLELGRQQAQEEALKVLERIVCASGVHLDLDAFQPIVRNRKALNRARDEWTDSEAQLTIASLAIATIGQELEDATAELSAYRASMNVESLRSAFHAISRKGDLDTSLKAAQSRVETTRSALVQSAIDLGIAEENIERTFSRPLPTEAEVEATSEAIEFHLSKADSEDEQYEAAGVDMAQLEEKLSTLALEGNLPTEEDLSDRRVRRGALWEEIKHSWLGRATIAPTKDFHDESTLSVAFEVSLDKADETADEMWRHADQIATRSNLESQRHSEKIGQSAALTKAKEFRDAAALLYSEFKETWVEQPLPNDSSLLRSWFRRVQSLSALRAEWVDARTAHRQVFREIRRACKQLERLLKECGAEIKSFGLDLDTYLELTESVLTLADSTNAGRKVLESTIASRRRRLPKLERSLATATENEESSAQRFRSLCEPYGEGVLSSAQAGAFIEQLDDLDAQLSHREERAGRIAGINERSRRFEVDARRLLASVSEVATEDVLKDSRALVARVKLARQINAAREPLMANQATALEEVEHADAALSGIGTDLQLLAKEQGVSDVEMLGSLAERAIRVAQLSNDITACEELLARQGGGLSIAQLEHEASDLDFSEIDAEISRCQEARSMLAGDESQAESLERELDKQLQEMDGSDKAASRLVEAQFELERAKEGAASFARFSLAKLLANEAVRRFAEAHQDPVLERASEYMKILTNGKYLRVGAADDPKSSAIVSTVDADHQEWQIMELSSGTRDALYLSLRFAALDSAIERTGPMPLVLDDVLVNLDEEHSGAALQCLKEISSRSEVLLFTHHAHIVELAESVIPDAQLAVHHLH